MSTQDESNEQQSPSENPYASRVRGSNGRLFLLIGLLALALFALWYDYKVARPAVEQAYDLVAAKNDEINSNAAHLRMTNTDVHGALGRGPNETFPTGRYTVEAYRWNAGMPLELRGLSGDESPGIGLKTHDYYAIYRQDGQQLAFVTHFKFDLDEDYFVENVTVAAYNEIGDSDEAGMPEMGGDGGGPRGDGGFDPEVYWLGRDVNVDGQLAGDEISERMREQLGAIDVDGDGAISKDEFLLGVGRRPGRRDPGGEGEDAGRPQRPPLEATDDEPADEAPAAEEPAAEEPPTDVAPAAESKKATADTSTEESATEPAVEAEVAKEDDL